MSLNRFGGSARGYKQTRLARMTAPCNPPLLNPAHPASLSLVTQRQVRARARARVLRNLGVNISGKLPHVRRVLAFRVSSDYVV